MESYGGTTGTIQQKITNALPHIFDFEFPIFDENHREELERKIVMHYFNREIGLETFALWKLYLEEKLNLEMPYYNELYSTVANKYDYLINIDTSSDKKSNEEENTTASGESSKNTSNTTDGTDNRVITDSGQDTVTHEYNSTNKTINSVNGSVTDTAESNSSSNSTVIDSDFPQATFNKGTDYASGSRQEQSNDNSSSGGTSTSTSSGTTDDTHSGADTDKMAFGKIVNDDTNSHKSEIGVDNSTNTSTGNRKAEGKENVINFGTQGSKTALMQEYRESILNVDKMVVLMLGDLFMGVY